MEDLPEQEQEQQQEQAEGAASGPEAEQRDGGPDTAELDQDPAYAPEGELKDLKGG